MNSKPANPVIEYRLSPNMGYKIGTYRFTVNELHTWMKKFPSNKETKHSICLMQYFNPDGVNFDIENIRVDNVVETKVKSILVSNRLSITIHQSGSIYLNNYPHSNGQVVEFVSTNGERF